MPALLPRILLLLAAAALVSACARQGTVVRCDAQIGYQEAQTVGLLRVPDDLFVPNEAEALRIPEPATGDANPEAGRCLELAPGFSESAAEGSSDDG